MTTLAPLEDDEIDGLTPLLRMHVWTARVAGVPEGRPRLQGEALRATWTTSESDEFAAVNQGHTRIGLSPPAPPPHAQNPPAATEPTSRNGGRENAQDRLPQPGREREPENPRASSSQRSRRCDAGALTRGLDTWTP